MDEETKRRAYYCTFVGLTPIAIFYAGVALIGMIRPLVSGTTISATTLVLAAYGSLAFAFLFRIRPRVDQARAWRFVLALTAILVAAGAANVLTLLYLRDVILAGAIYPIGGLAFEFVTASWFLKKAGYLPIRIQGR